MRVLFICRTPYQIFNAINCKIHLFEHDDVDIFVTAHSKGSKVFVERLKTSNKFANVLFFDEVKWIEEDNYAMKSMELCKELTMENIKQTGETYSKIFMSYITPFTIDLYHFTKQINDSVELCHIEDGMGSYVSDKHVNLEEVSELYLYEPELITYELEKVHIKEIPKVEGKTMKNREFLLEIFQIFGGLLEEIIPKYIYFDQPLHGDGIDFDEMEIANELDKLIPKDNLYVKIHPRSEVGKYEHLGFLSSINNSYLPFEITLLDKSFKRQKILMTLCSSAVFTPKLIYNREFQIILLYKLSTDESNLDKSFEIFIQKYINKYGNENIYIPKSKEELQRIIEELSK